MFQALIVSVALAAPINVHDAQLTTTGHDLDQAARGHDGWLAFQLPMHESREGPCCWSGDGPTECSLTRSSGMSFRSDNGHQGSDQAVAYVELESGEPRQVLIYNANCPVTAEGNPVLWVDQVSAGDSFDWLAEAASTSRNEDVWSTAMFGVAIHADSGAADRLARIARESRGERSGQAVFWLGEARAEDGYHELSRLLDELPVGEERRKINFALAQNDTPLAADLLYRISQSDADDKQRADALFWLSQEKDDRALEALVSALADESREVAEGALFGLAELESERAAEALETAALEHQSNQVRGQAMFWLSQGYPDRAGPAILARLAADPGADDMEQAVFALSQLPDETGTAALLELVQGEFPRAVRKQALFWLAQSDDPSAVVALEELFEAD